MHYIPVLRVFRENLKPFDNILWDILTPFVGILYTLAFAPFNLAYAAFPALAYLFWATLTLSPKRAAIRGYLFGFGQFGLGVSWVFVSIHDYGGGSLFGSLLITVLFICFWALFPGIAVYLATKLPYKKSGRLILFPLLWVLVEYLRGRIVLEGFPWLQIAYSQLDTMLAGYIPLVGCYGVGLLASLLAVLLIRIMLTPKYLSRLLLCVAGVWIAGGLLKTVNWTQPIGKPIKTTLIQGNISQDKKWLPEKRISTILQYIQMTEAHWDSKVIVWPESSVPAYLSDVYETFLRPLGQSAKSHQTELIISVPSYGNAEGEKYNSVVTLGREEGMYRKVHLLPFGEYMPWQPVSGWILAHFNLRLSRFAPGRPDQPLLSAGDHRFKASICYEDAFAENAIRGLPDAAYLVNATNDGWFGDSIEPHQHLQIARMRALETGRYLLRSTNTGVTAIISPAGEVISQAPLFTTTALTGMIEPMSGMTPFSRIGDDAVVGFVFVLLLAVLIQGNAQTIRERIFKIRAF